MYMTAGKPDSKKPEATKAVNTPATPVVAQPTTTTTPKAEVVSKQEQTVNRLIEAWTKRGVDIGKLEQRMDGKYLLLQLPNFPVVQIGAAGGIELPTIRSYAKAFDAAIIGDQLFAKQVAREQKKATSSAPAKPATPAVKPVESKESPTQKKQRVGAEVEKQLAHA
jgi:bifunctional pyridoxal-dependent enzyme with beta-cystathionase and maltose regulon repressor activities